MWASASMMLSVSTQIEVSAREDQRTPGGRKSFN